MYGNFVQVAANSCYYFSAFAQRNRDCTPYGAFCGKAIL